MISKVKRLLSLLLVLAMLVSFAAPVTVSATSETAAAPQEIALEVGESTKLKTNSQFQRTTWSSSDPSIATVSGSGTVTGVAPGNAVITAETRSFFGFGKTQITTYNIVVFEPEKEKMTIVVGETLELSVNSDGGSVTWSSSDEQIATVDENGVVSGVSAGDVTVTAAIKKTTRTRWFFWWRTTTNTEYVTFEIAVMPAEDIEDYYSVIFETNGGSAVETQVVEEGLTAVEPEEPIREGYSFSGWFTDEELTDAYDFATPVTADITLYAAWEEIIDSFTVSFETNGGSAVEAQVVEEGLTAVEPEEPIREGYSFSGWFSDEELTSTYDFETPVTADITLYAGWTELTDEERRTEYYVTFMRNDETGEPLQTVIVNSGSTVGKPADPVRDGYQFTGWYTDTHGTEAFDFTAPVVSDVVLFAGWSNPDGEEGVYSTSSGGGTIYSITEILVEGRDVGVTINTNSTAILRVEFLDEKTMELLAETAVQTPAYCEQEQLLLYVDYDLPESFLARATLYDLNGEELATYTSIKYTANYQIFEAKTADDYEAEGERVVRFSTQTNLTNFGVLADGVQEIPFNGVNNIVTMSMVEDDPDSDTLQWTNVYTIENPDETILNVQPGTVLLLTNPDGTTYLFKVGSVTVQENGSVVILPAEEVYMADFYKALKVDMNILIDENDDPETISEEPALLNASPYAEIIDVSVSPTVKLGGEISWKANEHVTVTGSLSGSGTAEIDIKYDAKLFAEDYVECTVITKIEVTLDIDVVLASGESEPKESVHDKYKFVKVSVPTPVAGLTAFFKTEIPVEWELSAGLSFELVNSTRSGFVYDSYNGRREVDEKSRTVTFGLEGKATLKFGPQISLGVDLLGGVVEASVGVGAGLKVEAKAVLGTQNSDGESSHACALCIDGTIKWYVDVTAMLELHIVKDVLDWKVFDLTIIELTGNINILKTAPGQFYISILNGEDSIFAGSMSFGGGACPNVKYRTQIKSEDVNGNETTGIPVEVVKKNGYAYRSGTTPHVVYLYDGVYNVTATISGKKVSKSVVVNKAPTTVVVSPSSADGMINGKVLDSETREPVIGASVVISMGDMAFADSLSDSAGGYTAHLPAGTYRVAIYKDGYVPFLTYVTVDEDDIEYLETTMMVEGDGQAMGGFAGQITNALDGTPVSEVKLQVRKGWNNTTEGDVVVTLKSDSNGHFESKTGNLFGVMIGLSAGNYTLSATKSGYVTTSCNVVVEPGVVKTGQNFTMSPALESEEYRVVLRWGSSPSDLDSHYSAITESGNRDHVYYSNRTGYTANLDRDDTDYEGPETITVTDFGALPNGFTYSVHDFTNRDSTSSTALSNSGAYVEVYCGDTLLQTYHVPTGKVGTVWNVFSVDGNGNLISRNTFENISNPESVGPTYSTATVIAAAPVLESVPPKSYAKQ